MGDFEKQKAFSAKNKAPKTREYVPGWKKEATSMNLRNGQTVLLTNKSPWNPEVRPGQIFSQDKPSILKDFNDIEFNDQLDSLENPHLMKRVGKMIERWFSEYREQIYDKKADGEHLPELRSLTPRQAVHLVRLILADRTEYSLEQMNANDLPSSVSILMQHGGKMSLEELYKIGDLGRHLNDSRDVESLLMCPDDKDVVCRNQAETTIVLLESVKQLQDPSTTQLETTHARILLNHVMMPGMKVGTLEPEGIEVFQEFGSKELIAWSEEVWLLSQTEKKRVQYKPNLELFREWEKPVCHALVQFITEDIHGRYHVQVVNTTYEIGEGEEPRNEYMLEAFLDWQKDASLREFRESAHALYNYLKGKEKNRLTANFPLIFLKSAKEEIDQLAATGKKTSLPEFVQQSFQKETEWCIEEMRNIQEHLSQRGSYSRASEQEMLTNTTIYFIETEQWDLALEGLIACDQCKDDRDWLELFQYEQKISLLKKVVEQKIQEGKLSPEQLIESRKQKGEALMKLVGANYNKDLNVYYKQYGTLFLNRSIHMKMDASTGKWMVSIMEEGPYEYPSQAYKKSLEGFAGGTVKYKKLVQGFIDINEDRWHSFDSTNS